MDSQPSLGKTDSHGIGWWETFELPNCRNPRECYPSSRCARFVCRRSDNLVLFKAQLGEPFLGILISFFLFFHIFSLYFSVWGTDCRRSLGRAARASPPLQRQQWESSKVHAGLVFLRCCHSTHGLLFRGSAGITPGGSAAVCDPNPPRPFARYRTYQKNPGPAPIKIKSALPPPQLKIPPPPKTRNFMDIGFPAERTHFFRRP